MRQTSIIISSMSLTTIQLEKKANEIRMDLIKMLVKAGSGHSAGPLDLADIFTAMYFNILKHDPKNPDWQDRDLLILSNGHCVPVRYVTMAHSGYFPKSELDTLRKFGSRLQGHPERVRLPGMETTSGPLGSGISQAAGMALALKTEAKRHRWVYCIASDGELNEGNSWEGIMFAAKYKLSNLIVIVDRNNIQIDGNTEDIMPLENLHEKWESFGWHVQEIDGHNMDSIIDACSMARAVENRPSVIIAHTIPGKGVGYMEYDYHWHGTPPNKSEMAGAPSVKDQARVALNDLRTLGGRITGEHQ